jgi:hypothetical protein
MGYDGNGMNQPIYLDAHNFDGELRGVLDKRVGGWRVGW